MHIKLFFVLVFLSGIVRQDSEIVWIKDVNLVWENFQGQPDPNSPAAAVTAAGISYNYSISKIDRKITGFKATVITHFYPEHSWCKKSQITDHILKHEQLHFDITELHSRLLRKSLSTLKPSQDLESKIKALYTKANSDLGNMQRDYDEESNYSRNHEVQEKWIEKVKFHLNLLESYQL